MRRSEGRPAGYFVVAVAVSSGLGLRFGMAMRTTSWVQPAIVTADWEASWVVVSRRVAVE